VQEITGPNEDTVMVETILDRGNCFGLDLIAEGVESETQLAFLHQHGCRSFQGYLLGKPMPIEEFDKRLKSKPLK